MISHFLGNKTKYFVLRQYDEVFSERGLRESLERAKRELRESYERAMRELRESYERDKRELRETFEVSLKV